MTKSQKLVLMTLIKLVGLLVAYITNNSEYTLGQVRSTQEELIDAISIMD